MNYGQLFFVARQLSCYPAHNKTYEFAGFVHSGFGNKKWPNQKMLLPIGLPIWCWNICSYNNLVRFAVSCYVYFFIAYYP